MKYRRWKCNGVPMIDVPFNEYQLRALHKCVFSYVGSLMDNFEYGDRKENLREQTILKRQDRKLKKALMQLTLKGEDNAV